MNDDKYIVGIGEVLFDCLPSGRQLGGAPANFAYHASQFGLNSMVISAVGHDALGNEARHALTEKELNFLIEEVPYSTGTVQVKVSADGTPSYDIRPDVAFDHIPFTSEIEHIAHHTQCVCFGSLAQRSEVSSHTIQRFLQSTPATALKVFDINLRQSWYTRDVVELSLHACNILKANEDEVCILEKMLNIPAAPPSFKPALLKNHAYTCRELMHRYLIPMLILTCGEDGAYVLDGRSTLHIPAPKTKVADTVGAGDSFTGAFCAALVSGSSTIEAHQLATEVSAYVCAQPGAMPPLPTHLTQKIRKTRN